MNKFIGNPKVLLVEDEPILQLIGRSVFEEMGCHVTIAGNGKNALMMCEDHCYDFIMMDIHLPDLDGRECTKMIRKYENQYKKKGLFHPTLIIGYSGEGEDIIPSCIKAGMDSFIKKPAEPEHLYAEIEKVKLYQSQQER